MPASKICEHCDQEYFRKNESNPTWAKRKYCGHNCAGTAKSRKIALECEQCGKAFHLKPFSVARGRGRYCSKACKHAAQRTGEILTCEQCGNTYYCKACRVEGSHFCSKACQWTAKRIMLKCEVCHKEFILPRNQAKKRRFCSRKCHKTWQASLSVELICKHCDKPFYVKPSHVSKRRFCSYSCRGIAECAKYLEEYRYTSEDLKERWQDPEYRAKMIEMATGPSNSFYGHRHTEETKQAISRANTGRKCSAEEITKRTATIKARYANDPEFRERRCRLMREVNRCPEKIAKQREKMLGIRNVRFGQPPPDGAGRCQWFDYKRADGQIVRLRGTYELRLAKVLDTIGWSWLIHGEFGRLKYVDANSLERTYAPDFLLPDFTLYIDTKGYFSPEAQEKIKAVRRDNSGINLLVATKPILLMYECYAENQL